jgi:hypothetical protein
LSVLPGNDDFLVVSLLEALCGGVADAARWAQPTLKFWNIFLYLVIWATFYETLAAQSKSWWFFVCVRHGFGNWIFSKVITQDLPMLVRLDDSGICAWLPPAYVTLENFLRGLDVFTISYSCCC